MKECSPLKKTLSAVPSKIAIFLIQFYQYAISPHLAGSCRFEPTCSHYGLVAFQRFGFIKGFKLTAKRISRCRPGGPYGYDPVPEDPFGIKEGK